MGITCFILNTNYHECPTNFPRIIYESFFGVDIRFLFPHHFQRLKGITLAHHAIAFCREMPGVGTIVRTALGGDDVGGGYHVRHWAVYHSPLVRRGGDLTKKNVV